ncbi:MAG: ABC transporter ATP-binding protein [bacterium]|nr:ABC transporter ATP-binding protein [bacterium]MCP5066306.1 ABC transporter ATP-binding protein [bacterium]
MPALELDAVSKRFNGRTALEGVSFAVEAGSAVGLLGPNGAGKTTALRLLLGLARPSGGEVRLRDRSPAEADARVGLGYLPERLVLPSRMTVAGFLALQASLAGLSGGDRDQSVEEAMQRVGVADRAEDRLGGLSKGLCQRVGFAQAFLAAPDLLLLDEPTSGLDPLGIRDARDWIGRERERGCTVLVSSHVLSEVERVCDRVIILHEGRIVGSGLTAEIVQEGETLEDAFVRLVRGQPS